MVSLTRRRVLGATRSGALSTLETVETDTPDARLTSLIVVRDLTKGEKRYKTGLERFYNQGSLMSTLP